MSTVRRYGPSLVAPQVSPRPELGSGTQQTYQAFQSIIGGAQAFIRPAVVQEVTRRGEEAGRADAQAKGPKWALKQLRGGTSEVAISAGRKGVSAPAPTARAANLTAKLEQRGLPSHIAQAFVINFQDESGLDAGINEIAPLVPGSRGGFGLYQLTGPRRRQFEAFAAERGVDPSNEDAQLDFLMQELQGSEKRAADKIFAAGTTGEAAAAIVNHFLRPAEQHRAKRAQRYLGGKGASVSVPDTPEYELEQINQNSLEPRVPFTVASQAYNSAAERVTQANALSALDMASTVAIQNAAGDPQKLAQEMERLHSEIINSLPPEMAALKTDLTVQAERAKTVAYRQSIDDQFRAIVAQQQSAAGQVATEVKAEAERLALSGATADEISAHLATSTSALVQFGPREAFTLAGQAYPADPSRAGILTANEISSSLASISTDAQRLMIEADFERSEAPGAYAAEFRRQVLSGNSPLPPGQSLDLMRAMEAKARTAESRRESAAAAERKRLSQEMGATINAYVTMAEAGVPVAIPDDERARILSALAPYPEEQRRARIEFAVADAAVDTFGMNGPELMTYVEQVRADMTKALGRGELDLSGAAVIESLSDRVSAVRDAVSAESIGLPLIEQLAKKGARAEDVNYDGLREQAAGKPEVLRAISEVEAFHRDIERLEGLSATEREQVLEDAREALTVLAAEGEQFGAQALMAQRVVERLGEWSQHRAGLAAKDPVKFAEASGVALPSFDGAESMADVAGVLAERIGVLAPISAPEGVENPVPLTQAEADTISDLFREAPRGQKTQFIGAISDMGEAQATAIFERIGQAEPTLYAAGVVYQGGNKQAASVILRGADAPKLTGGGPQDVAAAREAVLGDIMAGGFIDVRQYDTTALAYARGLAMAEGGREITQQDIEAGYSVALGEQEDGTGGVARVMGRSTVLPAGITGSQFSSLVRGMNDRALSAMGVMLKDGFGRDITADDFLNTVQDFVPLDVREGLYLPLDDEGGFFVGKDGQPFTFTIGDLRGAVQETRGPRGSAGRRSGR